MILPATHLAIKPRGLKRFDSQILRFYREKKKVCDLFEFTLFNDGVRRRYDFANEVYWSPHMSFPDYFLTRPGKAVLRGQTFPAPHDAERWLTSVYGPWRTPRRNRALGGASQRHRNIYGHRVVPRLHRDMAWCEAKGWDRTRYAKRVAWPRDVRGGGPIGPTPRTEDNSRSLWWRDLGELVRHY